MIWLKAWQVRPTQDCRMSDSLAAMNDCTSPRPQPARIRARHVLQALRDGACAWRANWMVCSLYAALFALAGSALVALVAELGLAPMAWMLAGGFLIVGPVLLIGFFGVARAHRAGRRASLADVVQSFRCAQVGLAGLSAIMLFLFLIWIADASILYGFMVGGGGYHWADVLPRSAVLRDFQLSAALMGAVFALIVFPVTAYSVPLLLERRANLAVAVSASVRAVFFSVVANALWALVLALTVFASVALPPLLLVTLPVLALAGESLYRRTFAAPGEEFCELA